MEQRENGYLVATEPRSIFEHVRGQVYTRYAVTLVMRDRLMGGIPKDPTIVEAWLRQKAGITNRTEDLRQFMLRTLSELGHPVTPEMSWEEIEELSERVSAVRHTQGFKSDERGLYIESRAIKAMIKECVSILYPYQAPNQVGRWGPTRKAALNFVAERVFVEPDRVYLGRERPDGVELFIGHTTGPQGPRSNLTYHEYVERAELQFELLVAGDLVPHEAWPRIWALAQENGLGALRSQGYGRFDVTRFDRVPD
jgi:hypothetical protein